MSLRGESETSDVAIQSLINNGSLLSYTLTQASRRIINTTRRPFTLYDKNGCSLKFEKITNGLPRHHEVITRNDKRKLELIQ